MEFSKNIKVSDGKNNTHLIDLKIKKSCSCLELREFVSYFSRSISCEQSIVE